MAAGKFYLHGNAGRVRRYRKLNRKQKREVKTLIHNQIDKGYVDTTTLPTVGVTYSGSITKIDVPGQGDAINQRSKNRITVTSITGFVEAIGYDPSNLMRVIIFKWMNDTAGFPPALTDVLQATLIGTSAAPLSHYNYDNMRQSDFKICYDRLFSLGPNAAGAAPGDNVKSARIKLTGKKLHGGQVNLNNAAVTGEGIYYYILLSDSAVAGHPGCGVSLRLQYEDA